MKPFPQQVAGNVPEEAVGNVPEEIQEFDAHMEQPYEMTM
jgi:hypothetical protein